MKKRDICSFVGVKKDTEQNCFDDMYIVNTQEKADPKDFDKVLPRYSKHRSFLVNGRAWSFSCIACVDPL